MTNSLRSVNAGVLAAAESLRLQAWRCRDSLPTAGNNRPPTPSNPFAAYVRTNMGRSDVSDWTLQALAWADGELEDKVPATEVLAVFTQLLHEVEARVIARAAIVEFDRPLDVHRESFRETKAEWRLNVAQEKVVANPDDPDALSAVIALVPQYETALASFATTCRRKLAAVRGNARPRVYGARRHA